MEEYDFRNDTMNPNGKYRLSSVLYCKAEW
jgi:hypothetical protein